ncbi:MAG: site-2 protease family protein [Acidimicrobiia bacterium]|nr:site-2 protease family protein [Acidimicrobiia bacterium]
MEASVRLARVRGIPIGAHWTWFVVLVLVIWSFAGSVFPSDYPGLDGVTYLVMGVVAALLLFSSIVLHELGHTFRALREGMRIRRINLWLFGGVAEMETPFPSPAAEWRVAIAGPAVSALLGVGFLGAKAAAGWLGAGTAVEGVAGYLAAVNMVLAGFNLIPAIPLDGGRLLHARLWRRQEDRVAATLTATGVSRALAIGVIGLGMLDFLAGDVGGGIWIMFIGWFVLQAGQAEWAQTVVRSAVEHLRVRQVMSAHPTALPADAVLAGLLGPLAPARHAIYPVVAQGRLVGVLPWSTIARLTPEALGSTTVREVMMPLAEVSTAPLEAPAEDALELLARDPHRVVVVEHGTPVGMLAPADILRLAGDEENRAQRIARQRRPRRTVWLVAGVALLAAAAILYHPPYVVLEPGPALDVGSDITITGVPTYPVSGRYEAVTVRLRQPTLLGLLVAALRSDREVISAADVVPVGVEPSEYDRWQHELFGDSQQLAAAAAARANGYTATATGDGARVIGMLPSTPAAQSLQAGDTITSIDGQPVHLTTDLHDLVSAHPAGTTFLLGVVRHGQPTRIDLASATLPQIAGGTGLGVVAETVNLRVRLPFDISFRDNPDVGGPSAGAAYALAIADMLDLTDNARGRAVAATGTIDAQGLVGEVGGVAEKAAAARHSGADILVVPAAEQDDAAHAGLRTIPANTLTQALAALRTG